MIIFSTVNSNGITGGIKGNGSIMAQSTAAITWTLQAKNTTSNVASIYSFGGSISFYADGISPPFHFSLFQENQIKYPSTTLQSLSTLPL